MLSAALGAFGMVERAAMGHQAGASWVVSEQAYLGCLDDDAEFDVVNVPCLMPMVGCLWALSRPCLMLMVGKLVVPPHPGPSELVGLQDIHCVL